MYLWQAPGFPALTWDAGAISLPLARSRVAQGFMLGRASSIGLEVLAGLQLEGWTREAVATAQIEGEQLQLNSVRASAARRLGLADRSAVANDVRAEATLDVLQAAVTKTGALTEDELFGWQAALFPSGRSGGVPIAVGSWRDHEEPMQIVTPRLGKPDVVHYEAPPSRDMSRLMRDLLDWFNVHSHAPQIDGLVRAAVVHLWFETIHPFEDGNGRVGRALAELAMVQDMNTNRRLASLSAELAAHRKAYYDELNAAQVVHHEAALDITRWICWFLDRLAAAFDAASARMEKAMADARYWSGVNADHPGLSASQRKALARLRDALPDGFTGGMSTEKYVNLTGVSRATAYRELTDLADMALLVRAGQGRGTRYALPPDASPAWRDSNSISSAPSGPARNPSGCASPAPRHTASPAARSS
jgi:Fic family protein